MRISFDRVADVYDRTRGLPPQVMRKVVQALVEELGEHRAVLDIGVGTGRFAMPLQNEGFQVVGVDISRDMMRRAARKGFKTLMLSDACSLPFRDSVFDVALFVHALHLISNWHAALNEACRVTKHQLVSVTHLPVGNPISETYEKLAAEKGYNTRHVGLSEQQLREAVKPVRAVKIASMVSSAEERLTYLKQRAYSQQWNVPEDIDRQIVQELAERFAGQKYQVEIHFFKWDVKDVKHYLHSQHG